MQEIKMKPIGITHSTRKNIQDDNWDAEQCYIQLDEEVFNAEALAGLSEFSHAEILFYMEKWLKMKSKRQLDIQEIIQSGQRSEYLLSEEKIAPIKSASPSVASSK